MKLRAPLSMDQPVSPPLSLSQCPHCCVPTHTNTLHLRLSLTMGNPQADLEATSWWLMRLVFVAGVGDQNFCDGGGSPAGLTPRPVIRYPESFLSALG